METMKFSHRKVVELALGALGEEASTERIQDWVRETHAMILSAGQISNAKLEMKRQSNGKNHNNGEPSLLEVKALRELVRGSDRKVVLEFLEKVDPSWSLSKLKQGLEFLEKIGG